MLTADTYDPFVYALAIWREARGSSVLAKASVAWVIRNRMTDSQRRWPTTPAGVILQPRQFSSFSADDPNATKLPIATDSSWRDCCRVVDAVSVAAPESDPTHGANHYHSLPVTSPWPSWAEPLAQTTIVDTFHFYKR